MSQRRRDAWYAAQPRRQGRASERANDPASSAAAPRGLHEVAECWICRDSLSEEPLVHPCDCRGSMAGVHASCVEAWVQSHRQNMLHDRPRCPVCRAPYGGSDREPGPRALARELASGLSRQLGYSACEAIRFLMLGALLVQYRGVAAAAGRAAHEGAEKDGNDSPTSILERNTSAGLGTYAKAMVLRTNNLAPFCATVMLCVFLIHKVGVLISSLPLQRAPPLGRLGQRLYTADVWYIARHVAELLATVILLSVRCIWGEFSPIYLAPAIIAVVIPVCHLLCFWCPLSACVKELLMFLAFLVCGPLVVLYELAQLVWRHRRRLANPLDGPVHVILSLAAVALCLFCPSRRPPLVLFTAHSWLLALALFERLTLRRLQWRSGRSWWCALLIALEAASLVFEKRWFTLLLLLAALRSLQRIAGWENNPPRSLFEGPLWWCTFLVFAEATGICLRELRGPPAGVPRAGLAAGVWFGLLGIVTVAANWTRCKRHYSLWQRRRATFVLCTDGSAAVPGGGPLAAGLRPAGGWAGAEDPGDLDDVA